MRMISICGSGSMITCRLRKSERMKNIDETSSWSHVIDRDFFYGPHIGNDGTFHLVGVWPTRLVEFKACEN